MLNPFIAALLAKIGAVFCKIKKHRSSYEGSHPIHHVLSIPT